MSAKQLGLCDPYWKQAEDKRYHYGADAGHEHNIQSDTSDAAFDIATGASLLYRRPNRTDFQNLQNCVGRSVVR